MFDGSTPPPAPTTDHLGHKANYDNKSKHQHTRGVPGIKDELITWGVLIGIFAGIYLLFRIF